MNPEVTEAQDPEASVVISFSHFLPVNRTTILGIRTHASNELSCSAGLKTCIALHSLDSFLHDCRAPSRKEVPSVPMASQD